MSDTYEDRVSATACGDIKVCCGGYSIVKPLERWPEDVWGVAMDSGCLSEEQMASVSMALELAHPVGEMGLIRE